MKCPCCLRKGKTVEMKGGKAIHNPQPCNVPRGARFVLYSRWTAENLVIATVLKCPECGNSVSK